MASLPIGVYRQRGTPRPFKAQIKIAGKKKYLGVFNTPQAAHMQVQYAVFSHYINMMHEYIKDPRFDIAFVMSVIIHLEDIAEDMKSRRESTCL